MSKLSDYIQKRAQQSPIFKKEYQKQRQSWNQKQVLRKLKKKPKK